MKYPEIMFEVTDLDYEESKYSPSSALGGSLLAIGSIISTQLEILNAKVLPTKVGEHKLHSSIKNCEFEGRLTEIVSRDKFGPTAIQQLIVEAAVPIRVTNYPKKLIGYKKGWVKGKGQLHGLIGLDYPRFLSQRVEGRITHMLEVTDSKVNELKKVGKYSQGSRLFVTMQVRDILPLKKSKWAAGY